jgi:hypothetical protein
MIDANHNVIGSQRVASGASFMDKVMDLVPVGIAALASMALTPAVGALIDSALAPGVVAGMGELGAITGSAAGTLGAVTPTLTASTLANIGVQTGLGLVQGQDLDDALKKGLLSGVGNVANTVISPYLNDLGAGASNAVGGGKLGQLATDATTGAAKAGISSLIQTGNISDAAIAALGGGVSSGITSGVNSATGDALTAAGIPQSTINLLGPTAVAALLKQDPTQALLKAALSQAVAAAKTGLTSTGTTTAGTSADTGLAKQGPTDIETGYEAAQDRDANSANFVDTFTKAFAENPELTSSDKDTLLAMGGASGVYAPNPNAVRTAQQQADADAIQRNAARVLTAAGLVTAAATGAISIPLAISIGGHAAVIDYVYILKFALFLFL